MSAKKYIAFFLPSLNIGGIEQVFICYANNLVAKGYQVDFVLCKQEGKLMECLSDSVGIVSLGDIQLRKALLPLRRYLKRNAPDMIITGGDCPNLLLILSSIFISVRTKIIISQHNYYDIEARRSVGFFSKVLQYAMKLLYPLSDKIIAVSDGIFSYLKNDLSINAEKIVKLNNPIDIDNIKYRSTLHVPVKLPGNYVTFIGRISPVKNILFLLHAFDEANIGDIHLVIVGDGDYMHRVREEILTLKKKKYVLCVGAVANPLPILAKSELLLLPSFSEAFPTILLEAMCLGKNIVATPTQGAMEILKNEKNGFISNDFTDIRYFARLIEKALSIKDASHAVNVEKYSVNNIIKQLEAKVIYSSCI